MELLTIAAVVIEKIHIMKKIQKTILKVLMRQMRLEMKFDQGMWPKEVTLTSRTQSSGPLCCAVGNVWWITLSIIWLFESHKAKAGLHLAKPRLDCWARIQFFGVLNQQNYGNQPKTMKNHETTLKNHGNQPKTMKNHHFLLGVSCNPLNHL